MLPMERVQKGGGPGGSPCGMHQGRRCSNRTEEQSIPVSQPARWSSGVLPVTISDPAVTDPLIVSVGPTLHPPSGRAAPARAVIMAKRGEGRAMAPDSVLGLNAP